MGHACSVRNWARKINHYDYQCRNNEPESVYSVASESLCIALVRAPRRPANKQVIDFPRRISDAACMSHARQQYFTLSFSRVITSAMPVLYVENRISNHSTSTFTDELCISETAV